MVRGLDTMQFSIKAETKNRLDRYKAKNKEEILQRAKKKRRLVSNDDAIKHLLDIAGAK